MALNINVNIYIFYCEHFFDTFLSGIWSSLSNKVAHVQVLGVLPPQTGTSSRHFPLHIVQKWSSEHGELQRCNSHFMNPCPPDHIKTQRKRRLSNLNSQFWVAFFPCFSVQLCWRDMRVTSSILTRNSRGIPRKLWRVMFTQVPCGYIASHPTLLCGHFSSHALQEQHAHHNSQWTQTWNWFYLSNQVS